MMPLDRLMLLGLTALVALVFAAAPITVDPVTSLPSAAAAHADDDGDDDRDDDDDEWTDEDDRDDDGDD